MSFTIRRQGRAVESHDTLAAAIRAFWVLTAHELKNGRIADYELDTRTGCGVRTLSRAELPDWAADVLATEGLVRE